MILAMMIGAPMVFSRKQTAQKMIDLLDLKRGNKVYDLGSGDARLLVMAAKKGAYACGVEINPYAVILSLLRMQLSGYSKQIQVRWGSYWGKNLVDADAVIIYGVPWIMARLAKKLIVELKPGTKIVSNSFQIPQLKLIKQETVGKDKVYLYKVQNSKIKDQKVIKK